MRGLLGKIEEILVHDPAYAVGRSVNAGDLGELPGLQHGAHKGLVDDRGGASPLRDQDFSCQFGHRAFFSVSMQFQVKCGREPFRTTSRIGPSLVGSAACVKKPDWDMSQRQPRKSVFKPPIMMFIKIAEERSKKVVFPPCVLNK